MQKAVEPPPAVARPLWVVILAAGLIVGIAMGLRQIMGLYLPPMTQELGIGREPFSMAMAVANLIWGLGSVFAGMVADRYGAGRVVVTGTLATMAGMYLMYTAQSGHDLMVGAFKEALTHRSYLLLTAGFFVCGFHLAFYGVHLLAFVADKGLDASVAVVALTTVGLSNLLGTWLSGKCDRFLDKRRTLSLIYFGRCFAFLALLYLPITPLTVILISALLGLFWLSTVPPTSGLVAVFFGTRWMSMLFGVVFLSHQLGSFSGLWLAGYLYDATKSYDAMWWISIALGLFAALVHWPIKERPVARLAAEPAAA